MDSNILLKEPCVTASSLSHLLRVWRTSKEKEDEAIYKEGLKKGAYSILRRVYNIQEDSADYMEHGKRCEKLLQDRIYKDERYLLQQSFYTTVNIGTEIIPFRATLDVFDTKESEIIELKACYWKEIDNNAPPLAEREALGYTGSKLVVNQEDYARDYIPQIQVQYLCAKELAPKKACVGIFYNEQFFISNNIPEDPNFIHDNKGVILDFWKEIVHHNKLYLAGDKQTLINLYGDSKISEEILQDNSFMDDIQTYANLAHLYKDLGERKKMLEESIIQKLEAINVEKLPLPFLTVQKVKGRKMVNYSSIFKDKIGSVDALTEEERSMYCLESSPSWRFSLSKQGGEHA